MPEKPDPDEKVVFLSSKALKDLNLPDEVEDVVMRIQSRLVSAYNDSIAEMMGAVKQQAAALERIQETLHLLISASHPTLQGQLPPILRVARDNEGADLTSAVLVADPIAMGFTMTQEELADALTLSSPTVSILARAFKLEDDETSAVTVRKGKRPLYLYHPRAAEKFRSLLARNHPSFSTRQQNELRRAREKLRMGRGKT